MKPIYTLPPIKDEYVTLPNFLADFYKVSHPDQYPANTEYIYSTWTPRKSLLPEIQGVIVAGLQAFVKEYLIDYFNRYFFDRPKIDVLTDYERVIRFALGKKDVDTSRIAALHDLGYLPLLIKALPEGTRVPLRVPIATIENTHPDFAWVTNSIESLFSAEAWQPSTAATIAYEYRKLLDGWAEKTAGKNGLAFVPFQGHDFSFRGMEGWRAASKSGIGHLMSFLGTDTIPAILAAEQFYGANIETELVGTSIPATEHSVMEALGQDEKAAVLHLARDVYPSGLFSMVSDTWDLWKVITEVLADPEVKGVIMNRDGKLVVRPDSGDPVKILCGDAQAVDPRARKGVVELLWDIFGGTTTEQGYKLLDSHIGVIYGDAITRHRANEICAQLAAKGFASINVVYGIGSYTYQFNTRDTFGFALKTTWGQFGGKLVQLFKKPVTDDGTKISQKGKVDVFYDGGVLTYKDGYDSDPEGSILRPIFRSGVAVNVETLNTIRERLASQR